MSQKLNESKASFDITTTQQQKTPFFDKPKLDRGSIPVILWNLFPLAGVLFAGWKPESVFVCYALETIVVGIFNIFRLLAIHYNGIPKDEKKLNGLILIPFFVIHFYGFVLVQLQIFFSGTDYGNVFTALAAIVHERSYSIALGAFVLNSLYAFINGFILNARYKQRTMGQQMFEPYPRVLMQQAVVILGGFIFVLTGNGYPVLIVFVALKMFVDLIPMDIGIAGYHYKGNE